MPEQSSVLFYLNWAKERIDEMDAALASLEVKASQAEADSKVKGDQLIADLKKRREEFQTSQKAQAEAGEAAWARTKADMEAPVERIRSPDQNLLRKRPQAGRAVAGHVQGRRRCASQGVARGSGQVP